MWRFKFTKHLQGQVEELTDYKNKLEKITTDLLVKIASQERELDSLAEVTIDKWIERYDEEFHKKARARESGLAAAEKVMGEVRGLLSGDGRLATGDMCRNCLNTMLKILRVGDALTEYNKLGLDT